MHNDSNPKAHDNSELVRLVRNIKDAETDSDKLILAAKEKAEKILASAKEKLIENKANLSEELVQLKNKKLLRGAQKIDEDIKAELDQIQIEVNKIKKTPVDKKILAQLAKNFISSMIED